MRRAVSFVRSAVEFEEYRILLKSVSCPRCRAVGHLIGHGFLKGFAEEGYGRENRGWRIFCSNRGRRRGCGRTHSILLAGCLRRRTVRAMRFWKLIEALGAGRPFRDVWGKLAGALSIECGRRMVRALRDGQSRLRSFLCQVHPPPAGSRADPLSQTVEHLRAVFVGDSCPVSAFHLYFQQPFLA